MYNNFTNIQTLPRFS